jgi:AbiV family abortive infection protein
LKANSLQSHLVLTQLFQIVLNGKRLKEDAELLLELGRAPTALALAVLAQEEFAKAFLLILVNRNVIPWTKEFRKALRNHESKHLIGVMIEWLGPPIDEVLARNKSGREGTVIECLPADVAVAVNILRHEKFEFFRTNSKIKYPEDSGASRKIADGRLDRIKQGSIYVGISINKKRAVSSLPIEYATIEMAKHQLDVASKYGEFSSDAASDTVLSFNEYKYFCQIVRLLFDDMESETMPKDAASA